MPSTFLSNVRRRRRWPFVIAALLVLGAAGAGGAYLLFFQKESDYSNPNAEFDDKGKKAKKKPKGPTFKWPIYGYTPDRARYLDAKLDPPLKRRWIFHGSDTLIEFQPVLANGILYYVNNDGMAFAVNAKKGKRRWRRKVGALNASSPAWANGRLFVVTLKRSRNVNAGSVICLNAKTGKLIWRKKLPSRAESSPIVLKGVVYFGSEDGTVYALKARNGHKVWTYGASGAVKGGLAYAQGRLFFGDYSGEVTALRAKNGAKVWSTGTSGASFNRSGRFYSTPAVAYGRVYLGNTDSFTYSFVARSGELAWRTSLSGYVYASPSVATVPRLGPTVFIGDFSGNFYALDAKDGSVDWRKSEGGKIFGASTIVGRTVYYSNLGNKNTTARDVASGKRLWGYHRGAFSPVISDGRRIYLTTYSTLYSFAPKPKHAKKPGKQKQKQKHRKKR
ncbi:MAG TPA: PQQ-binding-like beta-propeller repeat protein [Pyrinomonadaceae bacterium]